MFQTRMSVILPYIRYGARPIQAARACSYCISLYITQTKRNMGSSATNEQASADTVSFGFQKVDSSEQKQSLVNQVFTAVAHKYDVMNDVMSLGIHRFWKDDFVRQCNIQEGMKIIDVAGGTGDIAFRMKRLCPQAEITVCDINEKMLEFGKERLSSENLHESSKDFAWVVGDGQNLPFNDNSFDLFTISFGIRNYGDVTKGLQEAFRVLKPGGRFMCLEFSNVKNPALKFMYDQYSFQIIPVLGAVIAGDWDSYKYLVESIRNFADKEQFSAMIENCGFQNVTCSPFLNGIAAVHSGFKI